LDDVIWAKSCVNTAVTLVLDLSIGLGWRTEKRIVWDWEQLALAVIAGSLLTDCYDNLRYRSLTSYPTYTPLTIIVKALCSPLPHSFLFDISALASS